MAHFLQCFSWQKGRGISLEVSFIKSLIPLKSQRIDAFALWCWRRLLRVPWTARRSNQSILKEISPEYSLEAMMLKLNSNSLATWYEELTHWKRPWCWERLKAGEDGDDREWDGWIASLTQWTWVWVNSGSWWWTGVFLKWWWELHNYDHTNNWLTRFKWVNCVVYELYYNKAIF